MSFGHGLGCFPQGQQGRAYVHAWVRYVGDGDVGCGVCGRLVAMWECGSFVPGLVVLS